VQLSGLPSTTQAQKLILRSVYLMKQRLPHLLIIVILLMMSACNQPSLPPTPQPSQPPLATEVIDRPPTPTPIPFPSATPTRRTILATATRPTSTSTPTIGATNTPNSIEVQPNATPIPPTPAQSGAIIFMTHSGGELYRINLNNGQLTRLAGVPTDPTIPQGGVIDPAVSPDGQQIAFTRWDGAKFGTLYVINRDGSHERVIAGGMRQPKSPVWSPDGRFIMISFQHGGLREPQEICRYFDRDDGFSIPNNVEITKVRIKFDEVEVCFLPFEDLQWALKRIEVETGQTEDMLSQEYAYTPTWSPENPWQVIYDGNNGLVELNIEHNLDHPLTDHLHDTAPLFSPDGSMVAITYRQHGNWDIHTLTLATGERRRITKPPILADPQYNSAAPAWSPDGQQLAFVTDRTGQWEIWAMKADGTEQRPLFSPEIQAQLNLRYDGMHERMLNWVE